MKKLIFNLLLLLTVNAIAQEQPFDIVRLPITDYMITKDSTVIVQVNVAANSKIKIKERAIGALHINYKNSTNFDEDVKNTIGAGRCHLIKGNYYYFGIKLLQNKLKPKQNDLISFKTDSIACYRGVLFEMNRQYISFNNVYDSTIFDVETAFGYNSKDNEDAAIQQFVLDIQETGAAMLQQQPNLNYELKAGAYKGKKLLDCLIKASSEDVLHFLKYIIAKPNKYAGNNWKISEIFATWLDGGAPMVVED